MTCRPAQLADIDAIVHVHATSFPGFFLSSLGPRFLRVLYRSMMESSLGVLLVCEVDGRVVGFVGGVTQQQGFYSSLIKRNLWQFGLACTGAVLRKPAIAARLWRALRKPQEAKESVAPACLMSIAVLPEHAGKGIGAGLISAFCAELVRRNCTAVCLTTDKEENERTNRLYRKAGFEVAREFVTPENRAMYEYVKRLCP